VSGSRLASATRARRFMVAKIAGTRVGWAGLRSRARVQALTAAAKVALTAAQLVQRCQEHQRGSDPGYANTLNDVGAPTRCARGLSLVTGISSVFKNATTADWPAAESVSKSPSTAAASSPYATIAA